MISFPLPIYTNSYISSTDHHAYTATSILTDSNFPPSADSNQQAKNLYKNSTKLAEGWTSRWGADFIIFYKKYFSHYIDCNDENEITRQIIIQTTMFQGGTGDFNDKEQNKNVYKIKKNNNNFNQNDNNNIENNENEQKIINENEIIDWKLFWTKYYHVTPHLSITALCLLSIGISEACVERSFSVQKFTHTDVRNRMKGDIVEAEMRLRFNKNNFNDENVNEILQLTANNDSENDNYSSEEDAPIIENDVEMF